MALSQARAKRSPSGSRYVNYRKKKQYECGRLPSFTKMGETKSKFFRTIGANRKYRLLSAEFANVASGKKVEKLKIKAVVDNPANRNFVRRNIITKGTIIVTEKGKARVTSRPGQGTAVNAVQL